MIKLFCEFDFEDKHDYELLAKHVHEYNYRGKINEKKLHITFKNHLLIFYHLHQNNQDLFLVRFHNNTLFIESKCYTSEIMNVCQSIVYYLYATIEFDPSKVNIKVCNNTILYKQQTSKLIHSNIIFVIQLISIYFGVLHTVK